MTNSDLKFKCFVEGEPLKTAKTFDMNDVNLCPLNIPHFDLALPFVYMQDADKTDIYAGDILCLTITPELMDIYKNGFAASNLGKYIKTHTDITEIYLAICPPDKDVPIVPLSIDFILHITIKSNAIMITTRIPMIIPLNIIAGAKTLCSQNMLSVKVQKLSQTFMRHRTF